ncbi:MAG: hypothetical protein WBD73_08745 [Candidatus Acidiferrales bacterium]
MHERRDAAISGRKRRRAGEVLLVIFLGAVKRAGGFDFRDDGTVENVGVFERPDGFKRDGFLFSIVKQIAERYCAGSASYQNCKTVSYAFRAPSILPIEAEARAIPERGAIIRWLASLLNPAKLMA